MRPLRAACAFVGLVLGAPAQQDAVLVTGGSVLDASGSGWLLGHALLIEKGRIARIAPAGELEGVAGARRVDARGAFVVPGLIDLHSHLLLHPYDEASWDDQVLKESLELRTIRGTVAARRTLEAGFTTVRDLGTEGAGFADVALRDAVVQGLITGPRILTTTRAIVATGCYGPMGFDPRVRVAKGAQEADGVDGVRKAVREQIAAGADWIKVYADYRRLPGRPTTPSFSQEELVALVDEAKSAGAKVAAHATSDEGIRRATLAGVATIEHGYGASEATLTLMQERGVVLVPTLGAVEAMARYAGWKPGDAEPRRITEARETFARALKVGVRIANGSDVGVFAHGQNVRELELLVAWGMTPEAALRAATVEAARVLGLEKEIGALAVGMRAELVVVEGDPRVDVSALRRVRHVIPSAVAAVPR